MFSIQAESHFDSAHFLKGYNGPCANLHGHRWVVQAIQASESLIEDGEQRAMVSDFGDVKKALKALTKKLDHQLIFETGSVSEAFKAALTAEGFSYVEIPVRPTAEAMSKWFFDQLSVAISGLVEVRVYETPTNVACYRLGGQHTCF